MLSKLTFTPAMNTEKPLCVLLKHFYFCYFSASSEHSFSSDSSHDYCVPPESISPPQPPSNYRDVYDEVDDLYAEVSCVEKNFFVCVLDSSYTGRWSFFGNYQSDKVFQILVKFTWMCIKSLAGFQAVLTKWNYSVITLEHNCALQWIEIYPVDRAIHALSN